MQMSAHALKSGHYALSVKPVDINSGGLLEPLFSKMLQWSVVPIYGAPYVKTFCLLPKHVDAILCGDLILIPCFEFRLLT
jgi:hypothetical protein